MLQLVHAMNMNFNNVKEYYNSFVDKWRDLNCFAIMCVENGMQSYFDYINIYEKNLYYLVNDENPDYIIGFGTIEDSGILDYHKSYLNTGNIGYGIRPSERKKGYGTVLLHLLLLECEKIGMTEVCVSCLKENSASSKIIQNNNGKLEKQFFDDDTGKYALKYWIKLHPKILPQFERVIKMLKERSTY